MGWIGLAVGARWQPHSCAARRRDVSGREGIRAFLITQEAAFTAQAFIRDLAGRLAPARAAKQGTGHNVYLEAVQDAFA